VITTFGNTRRGFTPSRSSLTSDYSPANFRAKPRIPLKSQTYFLF
jgi:hypothetical protein